LPITFYLRSDFRVHVDAGWPHDGRVNVDYGTGGVGFEPQVDVDLTYGKNITGKNPDWVTLGFTIRSQ